MKSCVTLVLFCFLLPPAITAADEAVSASSTRKSTAVFDYHSVRGRQPTTVKIGRHEGESHLKIAGKSRVQGMSHYGTQWSGNAHLLWDGAVGESMETSFDIAEGGVFDITLQFTVAPDYGLFDLALNEKLMRDDVDLLGGKVALARPLTLEAVPLKAGTQLLTMKLIGSNPTARKFQNKGYLLGLDYIELKRKDKPKKTEPAISETVPVVTVAALTANDLKSAVSRFCIDCHRGAEAEGEVDLSKWVNRGRPHDQIEITKRMRDVLLRYEMPPEDETQPSASERARLVATLNDVIDDYLTHHPSNVPVVMRRMNRYEYNNAVRDLLQLKGDIYPLPEKTIRADQPYFNPASGRFPDVVNVGNRTLGKNQVERQILTGVTPFAIDLQAEGGFNNRGQELSVSPILLESFLNLGQSIVNSPQFDGYCRITKSFFTAPAGIVKDAEHQLAKSRIQSFLEQAFRCTIDDELLGRYHGYFESQRSRGKSFEDSMKSIVAAVLASPKFIYIAEAAADSENAKLGPYELATRLSFFLWSTIPDEELLAAARDGSILKPDVLDAQVTRMLEHPNSQALSHNFARQWLRLDQLITAVPDFDRYETYYSRIGCEQWKFGLQTMIEPLLLFESIMVEDRSIMLLIDSDHSWRSDELQSWYEDETPFAGRENRNRFNTNQQSYRRRKLLDRRHGGVITSAATLTMTSAPLRTSPIVRGAWVATVIFNQPPPPPPDDVPPIEADEKAIEAKGLTLRQRLVQHQVNPSCVSCHAKIDPLGFALENFDAVGRWRDTYSSGLEIDSSGKLPGDHAFTNVVDLKDTLLRNPEWFMRAFTEHMLSYALARELKLEDEPVVENIVAGVVADHGQFTTIVKQIVLSQPFRNRVQGNDQ